MLENNKTNWKKIQIPKSNTMCLKKYKKILTKKIS